MHNTLMVELLKEIPAINSYEIVKGKFLTIIVYTEQSFRKAVLDELSIKLNENGQKNTIVNHYKSTLGSIKYKSIHNGVWTYVYVKPMKGTYYSSSKNNEKKIVDLVNKSCCVDKPIKVSFTSRKKKITYYDIIGSELSGKPLPRKHNNGLLNKADVYLIKSNGDKIPLSIKDINGGYHWETADTLLKNDMLRTVNELIEKHSIDNFTGKYLKKDLLINTDVNLVDCVFGSDIKNDGCIIVTGGDVNVIKDDELSISCYRVFKSDDDVLNDPEYKPVAIILKNAGRNKTHDTLKGLASVVTTQKRAKYAINIDTINNRGDLYVSTNDI